MTETIIEAVSRVQKQLAAAQLDTNAAVLAICAATGKSRTDYLASLREPLTEQQAQTFAGYAAQLLTGKPVQYILGSEMFYGYPFEVNEHVLIPRPETEELVYFALERANRLFGSGPVDAADIGTGSGAIAVAFKKERPSARVTATDFSAEALEVAKRNAERNDAAVAFLQGDMEEPLAGQKWDIVLSNPPYIAADEKQQMSKTVYAFEPQTALFAEEDGLFFYRRLAEKLVPLMKRPSFIGFEIGWQQGKAVQQFLQQAFPQAAVEIVSDINGKERMVFCEIHE